MKTLVVKFDKFAAKDYHYLVDDSEVVSVGDRAVVHNGTEYRIVDVIDVRAGTSSRAAKTVVSLITKQVHSDYLARNEKVNEQKALFTRLEQLLAQESENNKYRLLAQSNAEAAEILSKLGIS